MPDNKKNKTQPVVPPENPAKKSAWSLESEKTGITLASLVEATPFNESSDDSGESASVGTRIPQWMLRRITKLREMPASPYDINSDVMRDAMYIGLQVLQIRYKAKEWEIESKMNKVIEASGQMQRIEEQVKSVCRNLDKLHSDDATDKAVEHLTAYIMEIDDMPNEWAKNRTIKMLKRHKVVVDLLPSCNRLVQEIML